ncbi:MAG: MATE family efflux transporter [Faecalibacillus faecis]
MKGNTQDLTKGSIVKAIILFSVPLLIGNLFQQLYNAVDSYVVGNYVGKVALAAVGASTPIINMLIGFFMGISTGAGVVIAQFFGAGDLSKMKKAIHNSIALTLVIGVVLTVIGLVFNDPILKAIGVPSDVFSEASTYLSIYFWSLIFVMIYNMGSGILRSVGDSKRPLYFLIFSSIINIILDFLFVKNFGFGVAGAGYATLIAQAISAIMVMYVLMKTEDSYKVVLKDIKFDKEILLKIIKIGLPTGLQQSIVSLSNVIVQSYINVYGASVIAGYSVTIKIDGFVNLPLQAFNMAITTFVGQNIGAKQYNRVKKGAYITTFLAMVTIGFFVVIMYFFGRDFIALFNQEKDVIDAGRLMQLTFYHSILFYQSIKLSMSLRSWTFSCSNVCDDILFVFLRQIYLS